MSPFEPADAARTPNLRESLHRAKLCDGNKCIIHNGGGAGCDAQNVQTNNERQEISLTLTRELEQDEENGRICDLQLVQATALVRREHRVDEVQKAVEHRKPGTRGLEANDNFCNRCCCLLGKTKACKLQRVECSVNGVPTSSIKRHWYQERKGTERTASQSAQGCESILMSKAAIVLFDMQNYEMKSEASQAQKHSAYILPNMRLKNATTPEAHPRQPSAQNMP